MTSSSDTVTEAAQAAPVAGAGDQPIPEAALTIYGDLGNPGRVLFSLDLWSEQHPDSMPTCDLVALSLFNLARVQDKAFNDTLLKVLACMGEMAAAVEAGAAPEALAAIRERHGICFRAE